MRLRRIELRLTHRPSTCHHTAGTLTHGRLSLRLSTPGRLAPLSTTRSEERALQYAESSCPLLFRLKTRGLSRGSSIQYLSVFPREDEYLYPPLTYLMPEKDHAEVRTDGVHVVEVIPQMA